jgi:two-component system, cell cycle sensor histidine kinase and response regulator CckA
VCEAEAPHFVFSFLNCQKQKVSPTTSGPASRINEQGRSDDPVSRRRVRVAKVDQQGPAKQAYRVLETNDGQEALSICQDSLVHINLVVTDFAMPRMTGVQLKEKVAALRPNMKLLLISGYAEKVLDNSPQESLCGGNFSEKPFLPDDLARMSLVDPRR